MQLTRVRANTLLIRIGAEIRRRRQNLGISQAALATRRTFITTSSDELSAGIHNPTVMTLDANRRRAEYVIGRSVAENLTWTIPNHKSPLSLIKIDFRYP